MSYNSCPMSNLLYSKDKAIMGNIDDKFDKVEYVTVGKNRRMHETFDKGESALKDTGLVVICIIAFIAGIALYAVL